MRKPVLALLAVVFGSLAMVAGPVRVHAAAPGFQATYTCDLFGAMIPVDATMARQAANVPEDFHLTGEGTGKAALEFDAAVCDPVTVAGEAVPPMNYALVSVLTDNDPTAPDAGYDRWESTNGQSYSGHSNAIGKPSLLLKPLAITIGRTAGIPTSADAAVNRPDSPSRVSATLPGAGPPLPDFASR